MSKQGFRNVGQDRCSNVRLGASRAARPPTPQPTCHASPLPGLAEFGQVTASSLRGSDRGLQILSVLFFLAPSWGQDSCTSHFSWDPSRPDRLSWLE